MINVNELYLEAKGKWKSLYPIYFDSTKTIAEGRRLSKGLCIPNPKIQQLAMAVGLLQVRNILEPHKMYSRDYFNIGRLKVQLVNDKNEPLRKDLPNKKKNFWLKWLKSSDKLEQTRSEQHNLRLGQTEHLLK